FEYLKEYCDEKRIIFLSSPFDVESAKLLSKLNVSAYKIPSGEIVNPPLLKQIAKSGKPIIMSTGMANLCDIEYALNCFYSERNNKIILLHCVSNYPARVEDYNLRSIVTLRKTFGHLTGISDHSPGYIIPVMSVALDSVVVEKHFTLDKSMEGPDHKTSLDLHEFKEMVEAVRLAEQALGSGIKNPIPSELEISKVARKSLTSSMDISKGEYFTYDNISIRRPGFGMDPKNIELIIGKKAKRDIPKDSLITWDMVE
ncbi:MAG: N-acetylneuraminate synthase family protein, partial [Candidatus Heimdallarchaeaceae archaeon]